jgi:hypothetical protein
MYADLKSLFETIDGVAQVVTPEDAVPQHDQLTPLLSLPLAFATSVQTIPAAVRYLRAPEPRVERWATLLGLRSQPRIGVAWRGSQHNVRSSMPVATMAPVLRIPGLEFHALHKEIPVPDQAWLAAQSRVTEHQAALDDFADTAALIAHLDLVISIDTSVAHLGGALGVPVWIMLPFSPDWRWLRDGEGSPWYPTARLFRQTSRGDWDDVVRRVAQALSSWRDRHQPP